MANLHIVRVANCSPGHTLSEYIWVIGFIFRRYSPSAKVCKIGLQKSRNSGVSRDSGARRLTRGIRDAVGLPVKGKLYIDVCRF